MKAITNITDLKGLTSYGMRHSITSKLARQLQSKFATGKTFRLHQQWSTKVELEIDNTFYCLIYKDNGTDNAIFLGTDFE